MSSLKDKRVIIIGGSAGIGLQTAKEASKRGARVVIVDRDATRAAETAESLSRHAPVSGLGADLTDAGDVARVAEGIEKALGRIGVLVNNAGTEYPTPLDDAGPDAVSRWQWLIDNNLTSMVRITRALLPCIEDGASIINQSSIWGHSAVGGFSAYVASKHAVLGLTRSLAWELAPRRIRVNAVCPGWVRTEASMRSLASMAKDRGLPEDTVLQEILAAQAFPQLLEPQDIAGAYLFLASRDARSITGQSLVVSNGELMH